MASSIASLGSLEPISESAGPKSTPLSSTRWQMMQLDSARSKMARPFAAPPGVPPERIEALRKAFGDAMKDPEFLDEARRMTAEIDPMTGEEAQAAVGELPAARRARLVADWGISEIDARTLLEAPGLADYAEQTVAAGAPGVGLPRT